MHMSDDGDLHARLPMVAGQQQKPFSHVIDHIQTHVMCECFKYLVHRTNSSLYNDFQGVCLKAFK